MHQREKWGRVLILALSCLSLTTAIVNPIRDRSGRPSKTSTVAIDVRKRSNFYLYKINEHRCSGSILTNRVLLTAAHCFADTTADHDAAPRFGNILSIQEIVITVGGHRPRYPNQRIYLATDNWDAFFSYVKINDYWDASLTYKVTARSIMGDIALILLPDNDKIDYEATFTRPVHLYVPESNDSVARRIRHYSNLFTFAEGFGKTKAQGLSEGSEETTMFMGFGKQTFKTMSASECQQLISAIGWTKMSQQMKNKNYRHLFRIPDFICAQSTQASSQICQGDSGGPMLMTTFVKGKSVTVQVGVNVWTDYGCQKNFNGFIRIGPYLHWIEDVLRLQGMLVHFVAIEDMIVPPRFSSYQVYDMTAHTY